MSLLKARLILQRLPKLLMLVTLAILFFVFGVFCTDSTNSLFAQPPNSPKKQLPADLAFVPDGTYAFCRFQLTELGQKELFQKLKQDKEFFTRFKQAFEKSLGIDPAGLVSANVVSFLSKEAGEEPLMAAAPYTRIGCLRFYEFLKLSGTDSPTAVILSTKAPQLPQAILKATFSEFEEKKQKGKSYFVSEKRPDLAIHFTDPRVIVLAKPDAMKQFLDAPSQPEAKNPLWPMLKLAGENHHLAGGVWKPESKDKKDKKPNPPPKEKELSPLDDMTSETIVVDFGEKNHIRITLNFPDNLKAKAAVPAIKKSLEYQELFVLGLAYVGIKSLGAKPENNGLAKMALGLDKVREALGKASVEQKGSSVLVSLVIDMDEGTRFSFIQGAAMELMDSLSSFKPK